MNSVRVSEYTDTKITERMELLPDFTITLIHGFAKRKLKHNNPGSKSLGQPTTALFPS